MATKCHKIEEGSFKTNIFSLIKTILQTMRTILPKMRKKNSFWEYFGQK